MKKSFIPKAGASCLSLLIKTQSKTITEACPVKLPDVEESYMKVYRLSLDTFRCFVHFHHNAGSIGQYDWGGEIIESHTYSPFWSEPDAQLVGLQIWEVGRSRPKRFQTKKRETVKGQTFIPFKVSKKVV